MHAEQSEIEALMELQAIDVEGQRARRELDELPQRAVIAQCRQQRQAVQEKAAKVAPLKQKVEADIAAVMEEDARLAERQQRLQAEIDEVKEDFRSVEARSKDLDGCAKRRVALEERLGASEAELKKVEAVESQVKGMLADLASKEEAATAEFVRRGTALKEVIARAEAEHARRVGDLAADLAEAYEKTASRTGGVAIGSLQGRSCGVCRAAIDEGRLMAMRKEGNLAPCPHCGRLLVL